MNRRRTAKEATFLPEELTIEEIARELLYRDVDPDWRSRAACAGVDVEAFYQGETKPNAATLRTDTVRGTCERCSARWDCLQTAILNREKYGIWGALDPYERERIRRREPAIYNLVVGPTSPHRVMPRGARGQLALRPTHGAEANSEPDVGHELAEQAS